MKLRLKPGERLYINGAVLRFENRTTLELLNNVYFLLERQIMQSEEAKTEFQRLYFFVQMMVIEPLRLEDHLAQFKIANTKKLADAEGDLRFELHDIQCLVFARRYHEAMKKLRILISAGNCDKSSERKVA